MESREEKREKIDDVWLIADVKRRWSWEMWKASWLDVDRACNRRQKRRIRNEETIEAKCTAVPREQPKAVADSWSLIETIAERRWRSYVSDNARRRYATRLT